MSNVLFLRTVRALLAKMDAEIGKGGERIEAEALHALLTQTVAMPEHVTGFRTYRVTAFGHRWARVLTEERHKTVEMEHLVAARAALADDLQKFTEDVLADAEECVDEVLALVKGSRESMLSEGIDKATKRRIDASLFEESNRIAEKRRKLMDREEQIAEALKCTDRLAELGAFKAELLLLSSGGAATDCTLPVA